MGIEHQPLTAPDYKNVRNNSLLKLCLIFSLVLFMVGPAFAADALLEQARKLMERKDPKAAYALLIPHQSERAGDQDYDYLLGIAALDSGKPSEAVFALERVLAVNPNHHQARAEIARAYYALGEVQASKQEFQSVQKQAVPPEVAVTIQKFLDAIEKIAAGPVTQVRGHVELTLGHDSNVNSGITTSQIAIPAFAGFGLATLSPAGIKASDNFGSVAGGVNVRHPLSRELAVVAGANVNQRANRSQDQFDTGFWDANVGLTMTQGKNTYTAAFQAQNFYVDHNRFRDAYGLVGQWQHDLGGSDQVSAFAQFTDLSYPGQEIRDAERRVAGVAYAHAFSGNWSPVGYIGAYGGKEREKAAGVPHLGHDLAGLRFGGQLRLDEMTALFASGSVERRNYGGPEPLFLVIRNDRQYDLRLGVNFILAQKWSVTPQISYTRNDSNIIINDFKREIVYITLRRDFQ